MSRIPHHPPREDFASAQLHDVAAKVTGLEHARQQLLRELNQQRAQFQQIIDELPVLVYMYDRDGRFLRWNRNFERVTGRTAEELRRLHPTELVREADRARLAARIKRVFEEGPSHIEADLIAKDGSAHPYFFSGARIEFEGQPCLIGMGFDISERKRAELALRASEHRYADLVNDIEGVVWEADPDLRQFTFVSSFAETLFGYPISAWREPGFWQAHLHPEDRDAAIHYGREQAVRGQAHQFEYRMLASDGRTVWIRNLVTVDQEDDRPPTLRGLMIDITERKQAEVARSTLESHLRQTQKIEALGTLAGGIAHDFNNLLATIIGNAHLAIEDVRGGRDVSDSLEEILRAGQRGKDLVQRILAFSRPQEQRLQPMQLTPLLEEAMRMLRSIVPATIELNLTSAAELPAVCADPSQLHQVVLNLVTNSWHALKGRGGRIDVTLEAAQVDAMKPAGAAELPNGSYVLLSVQDNGCGMDAATLGRVFEPFFTTKRAGEGTGLGLSVVHGIVRGHGGAITVQSEPERGALFRVYLPACEDRAQTIAAQRVAQKPAGAGEHILYLDDEESLVYLTERFLGRLGYRVSGFTRPVDALQAFRTNPFAFDLIITDSNMPGASGLDVARELLGIRPDAPIVLTSGYLQAEEVARARLLGVREVVLKPNTMDELGPIVDRLLTPLRQRKAGQGSAE